MRPEMDVRIRRMIRTDVPFAMKLKDRAGWNQIPEDWERYIQLEPHGCFVADFDCRPVATTTTIIYEQRLGWIGMVIVDPLFRKRGIATRMVEHAIAYLESRACQCQKLDATEAGARVYEKMGFTVEFQVERWQRSGNDDWGTVSSSLAVTPLSAQHFKNLDRLDAAAFGVSRAKLLESYCLNSCPRFLAGDAAEPTGYVMGRPGSKAWQMGPLVALNSAVAEQLMASFLHRLGGEPVIADISAQNESVDHLLGRFGFTRKRVLQRMWRGENFSPGEPEGIFCLAGFEFG